MDKYSRKTHSSVCMDALMRQWGLNKKTILLFLLIRNRLMEDFQERLSV